MNDVILKKINGGLGRRQPSGDAISGFLANGVAVVGGVQLDTVYRLRGIKDVLALGITEQYDIQHKILVYEHLNEVFRINPNADVYLMLCAKNVPYEDMLSKTMPYAKKLLVSANGEIKQLAVAYNPTTSFSLGITPDFMTDAQALADEEYHLHRPVQILLEGRGFDLAAPFNFRVLNSKNVSVMIGQSLKVANTEIAGAKPFEQYAAIGTLLGAVSKANVNENIAWVEKFNLYGGSLLALSIAGTPYNDISEGKKETLNDNGAIFFRTHTGKAGIYLNDSHTCTEIISDYAYIENNRTIDKAVRAIRSVILPRLNAPILIDEQTGQLSPEVCKSFESDGRRALEELLSNNEVSAIDVYVNPSQNILITSKLEMKFSIVPTGTARKIEGTIGFKNPF